MELIKVEGNEIQLKGHTLPQDIIDKDFPALFGLLADNNIQVDTIVIYVNSSVKLVQAIIDYVKSQEHKINLIMGSPYEDAASIFGPVNTLVSESDPVLRAKATHINMGEGNDSTKKSAIVHVSDRNVLSPLPASYNYMESQQEVKEALSRDLQAVVKKTVLDINFNLSYLPHHKVIRCEFHKSNE